MTFEMLINSANYFYLNFILQKEKNMI